MTILEQRTANSSLQKADSHCPADSFVLAASALLA